MTMQTKGTKVMLNQQSIENFPMGHEVTQKLNSTSASSHHFRSAGAPHLMPNKVLVFWGINYDNYLPLGLDPAVAKATEKIMKMYRESRICVNYCIYETEHGIKTAKRRHRSTVHTTQSQWLHAGRRAALCFIIFLCYHKLCHQHWNLLNLSSRAGN